MNRPPVMLMVVLVAVFSYVACSASEDERDATLSIAATSAGAIVLMSSENGLAEPVVEGATASAMAWSPNGQLLAFVNRDGVWEVRPGAAPSLAIGRACTDGLGPSELAWSPDGLSIAYSEDCRGRQVHVVDRSSGTGSTVYPYSASLVGWWSSHDGHDTMLVIEDTASSDVYLIDPTRRTRTYLLTGRPLAISPLDNLIAYIDLDGVLSIWSALSETIRVQTNIGTITSAQWSPSGKLLAFAGHTRGGDAPAVWIVSADGIDSRQVTKGMNPSWSATETHLAFERDNQVLTIDLDSGTEQVLGAGQSPAWQPTLSPRIVQRAGSGQSALAAALLTESFENGVEPWYSAGMSPPVVVATTDDSVYGSAAVEVLFTGPTSYFALRMLSRKSELNGRLLTLSAWVRTTGDGVYLRHIADQSTADRAYSAPHPGDGEWHRLQVTFTPSYDEEGVTTYITIGLAQTGYDRALVDGVQLEIGDLVQEFGGLAADPLGILPRPEPFD